MKKENIYAQIDQLRKESMQLTLEVIAVSVISLLLVIGVFMFSEPTLSFETVRMIAVGILLVPLAFIIFMFARNLKREATIQGLKKKIK